MGRVVTPLAAFAIALGLLAGASNTIVAADDDSTSSGSADGAESSAGAQSAGPADASDPPGGSAADDNTGTTGQPFSSPAEDDSSAPDPDDEPSTERPKDDTAGNDSKRNDGTCDPPVEMGPSVQSVPEAPQFAPPPADLPPPPADLPPVVPAGPGEPVPLEATATSGGTVQAVDHYAPPVLSAPIVVAPKPIAPGPVSAAVGTPRVNPHGTLATRPARSPARAQPHEATPGVALSNGAPAARIPAASQSAGRETIRGARVSEMAMNAMPGVAGLVLITASGVCIGYRQAVAAQRQQRSAVNLLS